MDFSRVVELIERGVGEKLHVGAQVCVVHRGEIVWEWGMGEGRPGVGMDRDTVMLWLSSCKPLTAVAILQLVERGEVDLEDRIVDWIPDYGRGGVEKTGATVRQVLMHTAGVRQVETGWPVATWGEILEKICGAAQPAEWVPGEQAGYSPLTSWFLLGEIVRLADGRMIDGYVREEVLRPLGLGESWLAVTEGEYAGILGSGRLGEMQVMGGKVGKKALGFDTMAACTHVRPSGSGHGPIRELALFYEALRRGGTLNGGRILREETVREMTRRQRVGMKDRTFNQVIDWGLGVMVNSWKEGGRDDVLLPYQFSKWASQGTFGHGGYQSSVGFCDAEKELAVGVVFNGCCGEDVHNRRMDGVVRGIYEGVGVGS